MRLKEGSRGTRREVQSGFGVRMELGGSWEEGSYQSMEMCFSSRQGRWRQQAEGGVGRLWAVGNGQEGYRGRGLRVTADMKVTR